MVGIFLRILRERGRNFSENESITSWRLCGVRVSRKLTRPIGRRNCVTRRKMKSRSDVRSERFSQGVRQLPDRARRDRLNLLEFSCHKVEEEPINSGSVKALLPARGDILRLARVGSCLVACAFPGVFQLQESHGRNSAAWSKCGP